MKKIVSVLLIMVLLIGIISLSTFAATDPLTYSYDSTTLTATVIDCDTTATSITIPTTVDYNSKTYAVTAIKDFAFYSCINLADIIIPDTVTSIGNNAFDDTAYYKNKDHWEDNVLYIGNHLIDADYALSGAYTVKEGTKTIAEYAFWYCSLTEITFPASLTHIEDAVFYRCSTLTDIYVDSANPNFTSINGVLFSKDMKTIVRYPLSKGPNYIIPDSVTTIAPFSFAMCTGLTRVTIPDSVTTIGEHAFDNCDDLLSIVIPNSVTVMDSCVFYDCDSLQSATYSSSLNTYSPHTFYSCDALTNILIPLSHEHYASKNGVMFDKDMTTLICCPAGKSGTYVIPDSVSTIQGYAFFYCSKLTEVILSDTTTSIGGYAFKGCNSLRNLGVSATLTAVGHRAFENCVGLTDIWYSGSESEKSNISISTINESFTDAVWHYNCQIADAHIYDNACDSSCNSCLYTRVITHNYRLIYDTEIHYSICTVCHDKINVEKHNYSNKCDAACNACNYVRTPAHHYLLAFDQTHHFVSCIDCAESIYSADHSFDNNCDTDCANCAYVRTTSHIYGKYVYNNDATEKKDGTKTRTCSVCGAKQTVTAAGTMLAKKSNPFTDVKKKDYFYSAVIWAMENDVTAGTSNTTFGPNEACTRAQAVTFLWRAAGCPTVKNGKNPFTDVKQSDYYYKAVLWAAESGVTSGTTATTFAPNDTCTRGQIVTFMWRALSGKKVTAKNPFTDVKKSDYYYNAVLWAVKTGATTGTTPTTFGPSANCTRGQIVTFLYRAMV